MFRTKALLGVLLVVSVVSISNAADIIYVDVNGPNEPGTGSYEDPFRRIQDAIDSADNNDTVIVAEGVYTGDPNNRDLHLDGKTITIRSTDPNDPNVVAATIIDCNGSETEYHQGFNFHSGEDANCVISGLTIRNGYHGGKGGGIFCYNSSPTFANCVISGNHAGTYGGAIFCQSSSPQFISCIITGNSAGWDGGALECWEGMPDFTNCIIADNNAIGGYGGGIDCYSNGDVTLTNCTLAGNYADSGGAVYSWGSNVVVNNSIVWANEADDGSQVVLDATSSVSISYCDVQDGWPGGTGNIDADPCFVAAFDADGDPNMWDFHLQSAYGRWDPNRQTWVMDSDTSPCIDGGDPNSHWGSELWPNGKRVNMGAYGGTIQASMNGNSADFDIDRAVNFVDFAEFSNKWFAQEFCIEDLSNNGVVDFGDLKMFAENWLWQRE